MGQNVNAIIDDGAMRVTQWAAIVVTVALNALDGFDVLSISFASPGIAQTGLAQRMRMDRATTMAIVKRLECRGYLNRSHSKLDGRKLALKLTASGRVILGTAKRAIRQHEQWLKARFTDKEVNNLVKLLMRIHE